MIELELRRAKRAEIWSFFSVLGIQLLFLKQLGRGMKSFANNFSNFEMRICSK